MKVGVFYGYKTSRWIGHKTDDIFNALKSNLEKKDAEVYKFGLSDLIVEVVNNSLKITDYHSGMDLKDLDAVYFANWRTAPEVAMAVCEYAKRHKISLINPEIANYPAFTKLGELVKLSDKDIPLPNSFILRHKRLISLVDKKSLPFEFPFIAKTTDGSMGDYNYLIKSVSDLKTAIKNTSDMTLVLQEFIPNKYDFRVIVLGGTAKVVIKRSRQDESTHVNNTSKGGKGELLDITQVDSEVARLAEKAAEAVGRSDFAGSDLIVNSDSGKIYVLEVNKSPQIETGSNTGQKMEAMTDYIAEKARQSWQAKQQ